MNKLKTKVYIDGSNTFHAQKKLGWLIDWYKAKNYLSVSRDIIDWKYYIGVKDGDQEMASFLRYLNKVGISVVTKPLKKIYLNKDDPQFEYAKDGRVYKANFDVEMTADMLLETDKITEIIIFSGDSDFVYLVRKLKNLGKNVTIYSSRKTISWELKLESAKVVFIEDLEKEFKKQ